MSMVHFVIKSAAFDFVLIYIRPVLQHTCNLFQQDLLHPSHTAFGFSCLRCVTAEMIQERDTEAEFTP